MARIHIAQFDYRPAYYDSPVNFLEEPVPDASHALGALRKFPEVDDLLKHSLDSYLKLISRKINALSKFSAARNANILVLPEYSIPLQILPELAQISKENSLVIIAGTHRVAINDHARTIYSSLDLPVLDEHSGAAICPVFFPDQKPTIVIKSTRSKWEGALTIPNSIKRRGLELVILGVKINLFILVCLDALKPDQLGQIEKPTNTAPLLVVCPSLSPSTAEFEGAAQLVSLMPALFAYANCAKYGDSQFYLPAKWRPYLRGKKTPRFVLGRGAEGIIETDVNFENLAMRQAAIDPGTEISSPLCFPIINSDSNPWIREYSHYQREVVTALTNSDITTACEWLDIINTEPSITNEILQENCKALRHGVLPMYDGDVEFARSLLETITFAGIPDATSLKEISRRTAGAALELLSERVKSASAADIDELFGIIKTIRVQIPDLQTARAKSVQTAPKEEPAVLTPQFQGDEDLDRRFQNRGGALDEMRSIFSNPDSRLVYITGPLGIGKSALVKIVFRKQLADWKIVEISPPKGSKVPRLIGEISYRLGSPIDSDALASANQKVFRSRIRDLLTRFFREQKRALIIDDLNSILADASVRDINQLKTLFETALEIDAVVGGKIIAVSSRFVPRPWTARKGVHEIRLRGLADVFVGRVLEYGMRQTGKVDQETFPSPSQDVLDLVRGNPLIAKLLIQADDLYSGKGSGRSSIAQNTNVIRALATSILAEMRLSEASERHLRQIAIFRLPVRLDILAQLPGKGSLAQELRQLAEKSVLAFDGSNVEMHEVVRRYFLPNSAESAGLHTEAAAYYKILYDLMKAAGRSEPSITAEFAHHLALSGRVDDLRVIQPLTNELKVAARLAYRTHKQYDLALRIYQTLHDLKPDDLDVLAYIGRCFGRRQQWDDCEAAFRQAITIAQVMNRDYGWLYRDWGHILARYQHYDEAKQALATAEKSSPDDASIVATNAYMAWREGDYGTAEDLFERALTINENHTYSLKYFSIMLKELGRIEYSNEMRKRLEALEEGTTDDLFVSDELDDEDEI